MDINDIKTVTVIGAGDMGHGIAEVALIAGFQVNLQDIKQEFVDKGIQRIYQSLEKLVAKGKVEQALFDRIKTDLLRPFVSLEDSVTNADLVIEAIPEVMDLKKATFEKIDKSAPAHTIIASNTSTMKITEIATATSRPDKILGLHYFNPAILMKLVEVIRAEGTSDETMQIGYDFVLKNNKVAVRVEKDIPGFIVNRAQAPAGVLLNCYLDNNVAEPEEIDATMRTLGMPMGPYELMDYTGLDINFHAAAYFAEAIHPDFACGPTIEAKVKAGELGKKTGKGLFDWSSGRPEIDTGKATDKFDPMDIMAVNINEATKIVEQGACNLEDIDVAIINATGNKLGLIAVAKGIEPQDLVNRLEKLASTYNKEIFKPSDMIKNGSYR
ncbi:MAG: 3-hydroxyacyl-CoA dehydrogenase family protein [Proteobacteria bacterium]|nr:3-hydroxyacyl-CoA dehydrogenase family protein [Pseudomonadota bacterium]